MKRVLSVVCSNGLGHFRRTIGILDRLLLVEPDLDVTIVCEDWQWRRTADWIASRRVAAAVKKVSGIAAPGVVWGNGAPVAHGADLVGWERRLAEVGELWSADLVLSDNLAGVLSLRPDAVLLGSFLWSDVYEAAYPDVPHLQHFVAHERALLEAHRPHMLAVGLVATPGVLAQTRAVQLPWMCEYVADEHRSSPSEPVSVGVFGGATGAAEHVLDDAARALSSSVTSRRLHVHRGSPSGEGPAWPEKTAPNYRACDLVVCRPGVGTVTACIAERVPMVLAYEPNAELSHNAACLEAAGIAVDAGCDPSPERILEATEHALEPARYDRMSRRMAELPADGLAAATAWIQRRVGRAEEEPLPSAVVE